MKFQPHISFEHGVWFCRFEGVSGTGRSPQDAYDDCSLEFAMQVRAARYESDLEYD